MFFFFKDVIFSLWEVFISLSHSLALFKESTKVSEKCSINKFIFIKCLKISRKIYPKKSKLCCQKHRIIRIHAFVYLIREKKDLIFPLNVLSTMITPRPQIKSLLMRPFLCLYYDCSATHVSFLYRNPFLEMWFRDPNTLLNATEKKFRRLCALLFNILLWVNSFLQTFFLSKYWHLYLLNSKNNFLCKHSYIYIYGGNFKSNGLIKRACVMKSLQNKKFLAKTKILPISRLDDTRYFRLFCDSKVQFYELPDKKNSKKKKK